MTETVYIETSILGYLTASSTDNLILAANMKVTQDWWNICRSSFILYTSEIVENEAARGDPKIASQRLNLLQSLMLLDLPEAAVELAQEFLHAIFNDLRKKQIAHDHRFVKLPIKQRSSKSLASIIHELESQSKKNGEVASS